MINKEMLIEFKNSISCGDVFLLKKNHLLSEEVNGNKRIINNFNNGIAVREFCRKNNSGEFYYFNSSKKTCEKPFNKKKLSKNKISFIELPDKKKNENDSFIHTQKKKYKEEDVLIVHENIKRKFKEFSIKKIEMNVLTADYFLINTKGVMGNGQVNHYVPSIVINNKNKLYHFSSMSTESIEEAIDNMEINLEYLLSEGEISTTKYPDNIIISNNALYELIYLLTFFLTDNTILSNLSPFYTKNYELRKAIEVNPKIKLIENSKKNKLITGNIDCEGVARNEVELISQGTVKNILGKNIKTCETTGSAYRLDINVLPYTKASKIYLESTYENTFYNVLDTFLVIETFQGLYETIDHKTLDFEATVQGSIFLNNKKTKQFQKKSKLNLLSILNNIEDFDINHSYVGDGNMLIPCAKISNFFSC